VKKEIQNVNQNGDSSEDENECAEDDDVFKCELYNSSSSNSHKQSDLNQNYDLLTQKCDVMDNPVTGNGQGS